MLSSFIGISIFAIVIVALSIMINYRVIWLYKAITNARNNEALLRALREYKKYATFAYMILYILSKLIRQVNKKYVSFFVIAVCCAESIVVCLTFIAFFTEIKIMLDIIFYIQAGMFLLVLFLEAFSEPKGFQQWRDDITINTLASNKDETLNQEKTNNF